MTILENKSPAEVHLMAHRASEELKSRFRGIAREHSDRIRQLSDLMRQISASDFDDGQVLAGTKGVSLSPELEKLIVNPTGGL
jgi:hypothetical protein